MHLPIAHPQRSALAGELHDRPFLPLSSPAWVGYVALMEPAGDPHETRQAVGDLCRQASIAAPDDDANLHVARFADYTLRWEQHAEFSSVAVIVEGSGAPDLEASGPTPMEHAWIARLRGQVIAAAQVSVRTTPPGAADGDCGLDCFFDDSLCSGIVAREDGQVWTDFRIHADGFSRMLVHNRAMGPMRTGRLVQRLLEVEVYRSLSLLSLPLAREAAPQLRSLELRLAEIIAAMADVDAIQVDQSVLGDLLEMSAEVARIGARLSYRFGASRAYSELVWERARSLQEIPVDGRQTLVDFLERRFRPSMRTCRSVDERRQTLARQLTRAVNLLATRVSAHVQGQNRDRLQSVDRRGALSLRLQETVERLSVFAITYYLVGLLGYGAKAWGAHTAVQVQGALVLPTLIGVWWSVRRVKRRVLRTAHPG